MRPPYELPPITMAHLIRETLQGLQGYIELAGLGRSSVRVSKRHLESWRRQLREVLRRLEER
jgi:hypothetical protein